MKAIIYTANEPRNDIVNQHQALSAYAAQHNLNVVRSFSDADIWNKSPKSLTGLQGVIRSANAQVADVVLVDDMGILGVNLSHMLNFVLTLSKQKVGVVFLKQNLTTHGEAGLETLKVLTHLAESESVKFSYKVRQGMRDAESEGTRLGRPSVINPSIEACVITLRQRGMSVANIAKTAKIGVGTTYRILKDAEALEVGRPQLIPVSFQNI